MIERLQRTGFPQLLAAAALSVALSPAQLLAASPSPLPPPEAAAVRSAGLRHAVLEQRLASNLALTVRPSNAAPGELFEVELRGSRLTSPSFRLAGRRFPMFRVGKGHWRGFGAVPLEASPGFSPLKLEDTGPKRSKKSLGEVAFRIDERAFEQRTLKVAAHFTKPSREHKARMRADAKAFAAAYRVPFGPPLFKSDFVDPRAGAEINSRFGVRRVFNGQLQSRHMGLDLDGQTGDPVYAANDGVVRMVRKCFAGGDVVLVSHGAGLFTGYYHLSRFDVKEGQRVKKGELIGLVGKSGRVTGPHLHFSTKLGGVTFDPEALFEFEFFSEAPAVSRISGVGGGP